VFQVVLVIRRIASETFIEFLTDNFLSMREFLVVAGKTEVRQPEIARIDDTFEATEIRVVEEFSDTFGFQYQRFIRSVGTYRIEKPLQPLEIVGRSNGLRRFSRFHSLAHRLDVGF
jgi:hypothetical protein